MKKLVPILCVDEIEPCLAFWTGALGFKKKFEAQDKGRLAFVVLSQGQNEIIYQSRASLTRDVPELAKDKGPSLVYIEVDRLADILPTLQGAAGVEVVVKPRRTFYGAYEIFVREPGGHIVAFVAPAHE